MSRRFLTSIDLNSNQLLKALLENLGTAPTHAAGRIYYDTVLGYARVSDGSSWGRMSFVSDPYARVNHTGTQTASTISDLAAVVQAYRLDQFAAPNTDVSMNSHKLTGLSNGTAASDAVNLSQLQAVQTGLDTKASARAASTANVVVTYGATGGSSARGQITAAPNVLDGVTLAANDRILLKDQSTGAQNGIWVVTTLGTGANGVWDRATDFDADAEVTSGAYVFVEEGTVNDNSGWQLITNNPIIIGGGSGTALVWTQFTGTGQITAGAGLTKTGNTLDVGQGTGITVAADSVGIDTSLTARWKQFQVGDGSAVFYVVNHALSNQWVVAQATLNSGAFPVEEPDIEKTDANNITVRFNVAPTTNAYRVSIVG